MFLLVIHLYSKSSFNYYSKYKYRFEKRNKEDFYFVTLAQLMSFCNQTLQISSSLSMIFTPSSYSSCCNVTLVRASSNLSEYILINVNQMFSNHSSLKIFDNHMQSVELIKYSSLNRTLMKTDVIHLPVLLNLCQFNLPPFEILITNLSKGCEKNYFIIIIVVLV